MYGPRGPLPAHRFLHHVGAVGGTIHASRQYRVNTDIINGNNETDEIGSAIVIEYCSSKNSGLHAKYGSVCYGRAK